jgi:PIN domain nuclease of toxin-antitoxin system
MIFFHTQVLYWWLGDPLRMSATAPDWSEQTDSDPEAILISTATLWELGIQTTRQETHL